MRFGLYAETQCPTVGTSEASFIAAGTRGVSIAAGAPVPYAVYAPGIDGYKKECAARGYTPDISFIRLVYLDEDAQQIRKEAERYVRNFLDFNASAIDSLAHRKEELTATGYGFYASGVAEKFRQITYDQCVEEALCFLGTPEQVIAQIRRLDQQIGGLDEMVIISNFGGIEHWKAIKTQHLALKAKPETPEEVAGTFDALYEHDTTKVAVDVPKPLIDNCGTDADTLKTLNISTGAAIIAAACGQYVVRHAARAISSHCGAVDVIEALGVNVESAPELPKQSLEQAGICAWNGFLPALHPKTLARIVSQIRFGSTFNLVGPLLNSTMPAYKVMGVPSLEMIDIEVQVLLELGFQGVFVMHELEEGSERGMDELSTLGPTHVAELRADGRIERYVVTPEDVGLRRARFEDLASSRNVRQDALALLRILIGKDTGLRSDIICLNAAPLLYIMGQASDLRAGIEMAREAIANGRALEKLRAWVTWQNARPDDGLPTLERMLGHTSEPGGHGRHLRRAIGW